MLLPVNVNNCKSPAIPVGGVPIPIEPLKKVVKADEEAEPVENK